MKWLELKIPPLLLALVLAGAMMAACKVFPGFSCQAAWLDIFSRLLFGLGIAVLVAGIGAFRQRNTTVDPRKPEAASVLVTSGVYRISRNPMYLAFLLLLTALALMLSNWLALLFPPLFVAYMNRFQIRPEEKALTERFGPEYLPYMAKVRRWL